MRSEFTLTGFGSVMRENQRRSDASVGEETLEAIAPLENKDDVDDLEKKLDVFNKAPNLDLLFKKKRQHLVRFLELSVESQ